MPAGEPERVLFVLAGLIGDSVMSVPSILEARRIWPAARIAVLGKRHHRELLAACPMIDEFFECNADPFSIRKSSEIAGLKEWLKAGKFDLAVILLGDQFAHLLAKAEIPTRVGVAGAALQATLTHTYNIGSPRTWGRNERLNSLRCLGLESPDREPELWVVTEALESSREKLLGMGLGGEQRYAVLHPFGSTPRQWWELSKLPALVEGLYRQHGLCSVLVGKAYDLHGVKVEPKFELASDLLVNALDRFTVSELVAVIEQAELVVTTDSGPFHIAGALRKPTVGLFRARRPEHAGAYPLAKVLFGENEICQMECTWDECCADPCRQMAEISEIEVLEAARQILTQQT